MNKEELNKSSIDQINEHISDLRKEYELKKLNPKTVKSPLYFKTTRKKIARYFTEINQRGIKNV